MRRLLCLIVMSVSVFGWAQAAPIITTYAGGGPNDLPATAANVPQPNGIAIDSSGNVYITTGLSEGLVVRVDPAGRLTIFAGTTTIGLPTLSGDGGPATQARLIAPNGMASMPMAISSSRNPLRLEYGAWTRRRISSPPMREAAEGDSRGTEARPRAPC